MMLTTLPRRMTGLAVAVSIAVLGIGTIRADSPSWSRPPYRAIAAHLDKVAGPADPIVAYPSLVGQGVPLYYRRPHPQLAPSPAAWRLVHPGGRAYVLIYDPGANGLYTSVPNPTGFRPLTRVRYPGLAPTDLFTYVKR